MRKILGRLLTVMCAVALLIQIPMVSSAAEKRVVVSQKAEQELQDMVDESPILALIYLCDKYYIRENANFSSEIVKRVASGTTVEIQNIYVDSNGEVWAYVKAGYDDEAVYGYVQRCFLASSDERLLEWEKRNGINLDAQLIGNSSEYVDVAAFPESYQEALNALKQKYPNWIFVRMDTGLDWNTVIYNELQNGRSLVYKSFPEWTKDGAYDAQKNWFYATEDILEYYMDPRNGLTEERIFQFELLTYNETYHTEVAIESFLGKTFMHSGNVAPGTNSTYANIFWTIGSDESMQVSPFHLAARVLQEQGAGTSSLISGTYPGYEGYYNYFNVKASGTSDKEVIENGLAYAKEQNWYNAYEAIKGGAGVVSTNYIRKGQDTLYLQKYNVNSDGHYPLYTHQYMQNISAPTTEGVQVSKLYSGSAGLNNIFVFKIPVYENMPGEACEYPTADSAKNGLCLGSDGVWHYYNMGKVDETFTGLALNETGWWYVKNGTLDWNYTGLAQNEYGWWYVEKGGIGGYYTGLIQNEAGWWYVKDGKVDFDYTGLAQNEIGWWYVKNGQIDFTYTGMAFYDYNWWFVRNGALDWNYIGLAQNEYGWWYMRGGYIDRTYTGLVENEAGWWYVKDGEIDFDYVGFAENEIGCWYVNGGCIDFGYTGLASDGEQKKYVTNGLVDKTVNGLKQVEDVWWYMKDGSVDGTYAGLVQNEIGWWYVREGKIDFEYTGFAENELGCWYVEGGTIDFGYTGLATVGEQKKYVTNGLVDKTINGLKQIEDAWWYMKDGCVDSAFTGLVQNEIGWWYVQNGSIDFSFNGTVEHQGVTYNVQNGAVVF